MLGTGHLAASALDTVGCIGFTVGEQEPFLLKIKLLNHFFLGFIHQQFFIVILHKIGNRNIDRATPHAVAATGTEFVHFIGYMTADPLDIGICKRGGLIGDVTRHVNMLLGRKPVQRNRNLRAADAEPQCRLGGSFAFAGKKSQRFFILRNNPPCQRIHRHNPKPGLASGLDTLPPVQKIQNVDAEQNPFEFMVADQILHFGPAQMG